MSLLRLLLSSCSVFFLAGGLLFSAEPFEEAFDQGGSDLEDSRFSVAIVAGGGVYTREDLASSPGVPNTSPPLPINAGGDKELYFYEESPTGGGYAVMANLPENIYSNVTIDGFVGFGVTGQPSSRSAALLARMTGESTTTSVNAYAAIMSANLVGESSFALYRIRDGVVTPADVLIRSDYFPTDPTTENYRIVLSVYGTNIRGMLWRVKAEEGSIVQSPVDLVLDVPGIQNQLEAADEELASGRVGVTSFARKDSEIFYDDIRVGDFVFTDGFETGDLTSWSGLFPPM